MLYHIRPALTTEGVSRSPRDVVRDAMDALISQACDTDAYGQAVWSCPANAGDKLRNDPRSDGGNQAGSPGRSRSSRNTIAQGVPGISAYLCWPARVFFILRVRQWVRSCTRHSLRPLFGRSKVRAKLGREIAPRGCEPLFDI